MGKRLVPRFGRQADSVAERDQARVAPPCAAPAPGQDWPRRNGEAEGAICRCQQRVRSAVGPGPEKGLRRHRRHRPQQRRCIRAGPRLHRERRGGDVRALPQGRFPVSALCPGKPESRADRRQRPPDAGAAVGAHAAPLPRQEAGHVPALSGHGGRWNGQHQAVHHLRRHRQAGASGPRPWGVPAGDPHQVPRLLRHRNRRREAVQGVPWSPHRGNFRRAELHSACRGVGWPGRRAAAAGPPGMATRTRRRRPCGAESATQGLPV
mmetsp:Transcript_25196/g.95220  ORF Transcript_25196/g.95220 Transcript_25196/m.95220 type:complete len:265 (-) Transcript_25196:805-1599(-)